MAERVPILRTPVAPGTIIEVYAIGEPLREAGIARLREYLEIMAHGYNLPSETRDEADTGVDRTDARSSLAN